MNLKPRRLPTKSKRIHKDQTQQLSNHRRIVLKEQKNELQVDQNIISYGELDTTTKKIFITAIKQCILSGCIQEIFTYPRNLRCKPRSIVILDSDANHMIWKMLRILSKEECNRKLVKLSQKLQQKQAQIIEHGIMKAKLNQNSIDLSKKYNKLLQDSQKQEMLGLLQQISNQIKAIQTQQLKAVSKQQNLRQKISLYKASIQISNKNNKILKQSQNRAIRQMISELICQSIIAIVEIPLQKNKKCLPVCEQVYVIFQQCYPTTKIKFTDITRIIGTSQYLNKCQKIAKSISKPEQKQHSVIETLTMCHICLQIIEASELVFCRNIISNRQINPYCSFDIQLYHQNVIQSDYFSKPKKTATLPFFLYNKDQNGQLCCNRAFCKKCIKSCDNNQGEFICPFCFGDCNCRRCELGVKLVKILAQDLEFDSQMQKNYHNVLSIFHQKPSKYCGSGRLGLRTQKDTAEFYQLFPYLRRRLVAHASIDYSKNNSSGQEKSKNLRWSRHLQERFSNLTTPDGLSEEDQQSSSVDSRFRDPRYKYFQHWRNL